MHDRPSDEELPPSSGSGRAIILIWVLVALGLLAALLIVVSDPGPVNERGASHPSVGQKMPEFEFQPLVFASQPVNSKTVMGSVTLINFWGTWCPPCREEFPHLARIYRENHGRPNFRFLSISCEGADAKDLKRETQRYLEKGGVELPVYSDLGEQTRGALAGAGLFFGYPTTIILDGNRKIRGLWNGYQRGYEREMEALVKELLRE